MTSILLFFSVFLLSGFWLHAQDLVLVNDDIQAVIVIPDRPQGDLMTSAKLVQSVIRRATMTELPIVVESKLGDAVSAIFLGNTKRASMVLGDQAGSLSADGFIMHADNTGLVLAGTTREAHEWAAQEFLRRYCGARWYMSGPLWETVHEVRQLSVPLGTEMVEPAYRSRWHSGMNQAPMTLANNRWMRKHGAQFRDDFHHAYLRYFKGATYGKDHPEYYSEVNGKRMVPGPGSLRGWQVCMTNPNVVAEYAKIAREQFDQRPAMTSISLSPNDGGVFCECATCKPLWGAEEDEMTYQTELVFTLVNGVAKELAKTHPDKQVGILAYGGYRLPTSDLRVEPNVIVYIVGCRSGVGEPDAWAKYEESIQSWKRAGVQHIGIYEWHHGSFFVVPPVYPHVLGKVMRYAHEQGATGWYSEDYPSWGLQGPSHWIVRRLLWDPTQDVDALLNEYCTDLFGSAAPIMLAYFNRCEHQWITGKTGGGMADEAQFASYPLEARRELREMLDDALAKTVDEEPAHQRVRFFSDTFGLTERMASFHEAGIQALQAAEEGQVANALGALAGASGPDKDPLLYLKMVLDNWPGAYYYQSASADKEFAVGMRPGVNAKIKVARSIMMEAGEQAMAAEPLTAGAYQAALEEAVGRRLPAVQTEEMQQAATAVKEYASKVVLAPEVDVAPIMDGKLDDSAWKGLPETTGFYGYGSGLPARFRTPFRLVRKGDWLYGAFTCYQSMERPKAAAGVHDGPVWLDDAVEIFLNRSDATEETDYFQAIINVDGVVFDQYQKNAKWNGDISVGTARYDDHWVLEMAIPLDTINMSPRECRGLRLNVVRDKWGGGLPPQICPWFPTTFGHADLHLRGWLLFP